MKRIVVFAVPLFVVIVIAFQRPKSPHDFSNSCKDCHLGISNPSMLLRDPDFLCIRCHDDQKNVSHPSNFVPQKQIPPQFPLYQGKLTCISCHIAHETYDLSHADHPEFDSNPFFLRSKKAGKVFCFKCHQGDFTTSAVDSHATSYQVAHQIKSKSVPGQLDDHSIECLSCHDGTLSQSANNPQGTTWEHNQSIGVSHPIAISYEDAYNRHPDKFVPLSQLDSRINLFNGNLGCETCHMIFGNDPSMLVMGNIRSRLCLSCHVL